MNVKEVKTLFAFNAWATNRIFDAVVSLQPENISKDMSSSHGSIFATMVHLVGAEKMWLSRWVGKQDSAFLSPENVPSMGDLRNLWNTVGFETAKFLAGLDDRKLQDFFEMKTSKGEIFRHIYWQAMLHLVDHSTYHRAQVVTMMRQLGVTPPATGMIMFFREAAKLQKS
jgi:uncharacterized damage-inducible protein DinB